MGQHDRSAAAAGGRPVVPDPQLDQSRFSMDGPSQPPGLDPSRFSMDGPSQTAGLDPSRFSMDGPSGAPQQQGPLQAKDVPGTVAYGARQAQAGGMGAEKEPPGFFQETPGQAISQFARTTKQSFQRPYPQVLGGTSLSDAVDSVPPETFGAATAGAGLTGVPPELIKGAAKSIATRMSRKAATRARAFTCTGGGREKGAVKVDQLLTEAGLC